MDERWAALESRCRNCCECALSQTRKQVVFGAGNPEAEILLIGEGPGANEDEQGIPFVGRAGKLLDDMLALIGLDRTKVYITNIVKCRPPNNRDPLHVEQELCIGYLKEQIALIRPKIIICLGRVAAMQLIDEKFKITREHGVWFEREGVRMMALYHPAALLRDGRRLPETYDDLKEIKREIERSCERTVLQNPWTGQ